MESSGTNKHRLQAWEEAAGSHPSTADCTAMGPAESGLLGTEKRTSPPIPRNWLGNGTPCMARDPDSAPETARPWSWQIPQCTLTMIIIAAQILVMQLNRKKKMTLETSPRQRNQTIS